MKRLLLAAAFFLPFCAYLYTLHPSVPPYRDSGDLIAAAATLGIAHPPGYPLYVMAGKAFTALSGAGNPGYAMNVMSAAAAAAALMFAALTILTLTGSCSASLPVFLLAFSPAYWRLAQVSEMYSLNALLASLLIYFAARFYSGKHEGRISPGPAPAYFLAFTGGLALTNHPTIVFIYPGLLWLAAGSGQLRPKDYFTAALFFLAGMSADLFIIVRASADPVINWGKPEDLEGFLRAITRADYGGLKLHPEQSKFSWTAAAASGHLLVYLKSLAEQFTLPGALLGAWGMFLRRKDRFYQFLFVSLVISGPLFVILSNLPPSEKTTLPILEPHLVLPNLIFAFFMAAAAEKTARYGTAGTAALAALVMVLFAIKLPLCDYRRHYYAYDYGKNIFRTAPPDSVVYDPDDATAFVIAYMQSVAGKRTDIKLAAYFRTRWGYELLKERHPEILPPRDIPSGQELARELLEYNRPRRPVFAELPGKFPPEYLSYPEGLLNRLSEKGELDPSSLPFEMYSLRGASAPGDRDFFTDHVVSYYSSAHNNLGLSLAKLGKASEARAEYMKAFSLDPRLGAALNNMGTLEFSLKNYGAAEKWFLRLLKMDPNSAFALYNTGLTYRALKDDGTAKSYLEKAWGLHLYPEAGNELGLMALEKGDAERARELFSAVLKYRPVYAPAHYNMALSERALGNYPASRKHFAIYLGSVSDPRERAEAAEMMEKLPH